MIKRKIWRKKRYNEFKKRDARQIERILKKAKTLYASVVYYSAGVREYYYAGLDDADGMPLVWNYWDGNGACSMWLLERLEDTTTGGILGWFWTEEEACACSEQWQKEYDAEKKAKKTTKKSKKI